MTPEDEIIEALRQAGRGACMIWPHEEVIEVSEEYVTVYDTETGLLRDKPL